jgi:hypothetical protein
MDLHEWLDKPENKGRAAWLAEQLDRSKTAVSLWREEGIPLPLIPKIASLTFGEVTEAEMLRHTMACKLAKPRRTAA